MFERLPLRDIHLPDPVSWWPPGPGWWLLPVVAALVYLLMLSLARRVRGAARRRRVRRQALRELAHIESDYAVSGDPGRTLERVSILLRRVAVTAFPDRRIAGLAGAAWASWIRRTGPRDLEAGAVSALVHGPYSRSPQVPAPAVLRAARSWIRYVTGAAGPRP